MHEPIHTDEKYRARMDALKRLDIKRLTPCEHAIREIKAALAYHRQELQELEADRREIPHDLYRTLRQLITITIHFQKRTLYDLLQRQEVNLQRLASTDMGEDAADA